MVLAAEKKEASSLFVPTRESGKLYKMDNHVLVSVSGVVADANMLMSAEVGAPEDFDPSAPATTASSSGARPLALGRPFTT